MENQLANKKTARVLEQAFGAEWTNEYMTTVMFDFCPDEEPAWADASLAKLYEHFDYFPEMGVWPVRVKELEVSVGMTLYVLRLN